MPKEISELGAGERSEWVASIFAAVEVARFQHEAVFKRPLMQGVRMLCSWWSALGRSRPKADVLYW